jgi:Zn-dependent protease with chaperone function
MEFENKEIPENFNVSKENPLISMGKMLTGVAAISAIFVVVVMLVMNFAAPLIPFSWEKSIADDVFFSDDHFSSDNGSIEKELQSLGGKISSVMNMPEGMSITIHYVDDDTVNAFASLGGHIFVHRGLLEKIESENALAMVLAHEMAHIKNRDVITAMSSRLIIAITLAAVTQASETDATIVTELPSSIAYLGYSRSMEKRADLAGLDALNKLYGHINGANQMYEVLEEVARKEKCPEDADEEECNAEPRYLTFLRTHPTTDSRKVAMEALAKDKYWMLDGDLTEMPEVLIVSPSKDSSDKISLW